MGMKNFGKSLFVLLCLLVVLIASGCDKEDSIPPFHINSFILKDVNSNQYHPFFITSDSIHFYIPKGIDLSTLTPIFNISSKIYYKGTEVVSGANSFDFSDFTKPVVFTYTDSDRSVNEIKVCIYDLPVITIDTPDFLPIISKEERKEECVVGLINEEGNVLTIGNAGIRGRGGSSWLEPKKPYNLKFDEKVSFLGLKESKHWVLLANARYDRTQLHNATAYKMASMTDYPWVQQGKFVELFLNKEHKGLYYICEKIGEEKGKINLEGDEEFLIESTLYPTSNVATCFISDLFNSVWGGYMGATSYGWEVKYPSDISTEKLYRIKNKLEDIEGIILNDDSLYSGAYRNYFDIESAINWWFVEEVCQNEEASRNKNVYMYYKSNGGGKLYIGPPWDFDAWTFGLYGTKKLWCNRSLYLERLFKEAGFVLRLKDKWDSIYTVWRNEIPLFIEDQYDLIHKSAERNAIMWPSWYYHYNTYRDCVDEMKNNFIEQIDWLNEYIKNLGV